MSKEVMQQAQLLCEWISETPHQRGSINGLAAQVLHSISAALAAPQPEKRLTGLILSEHRDPMNGASIPNPLKFGAAPHPGGQDEYEQWRKDGSPAPAPQPARIPAWTEDQKAQLNTALGTVFGWAPQPAQEPVAYRYRFGDVWMFDTCRWNGQNPDEVVPVYTTPQAPQPLSLGALAKRRIFDAIRGAYDLGYNDARNARTTPGDSAPGYKGRDVEADHGGALLSALNQQLASGITKGPAA